MNMTEQQIAIVVGFAFGVVLHRIGATNPNLVINMLRLRNFHLMKVILAALGLSTLALYLGIEFSMIDVTHLDIKRATYGVIAGGAIFGLGWTLSGYCPGSAIVAFAEGRLDALVFILGGLIGSFIFMLTYKYFDDGFLFHAIQNSNLNIGMTIGQVKGLVNPYLVPVSALYTGIILAALKLIIAFLLPNR